MSRAHRTRLSELRRWSVCVFGATALGCIDAQVDFQRLPTDEQLAAIQPGRTTRAEVLQRLGPPEEVRQRGAGEGMRRLDGRQSRAEAGNVFGNSTWTWASERRTERIVGVLPVALVLFRVRNSTALQEQWRIEFDEDGIVRSMSHIDEISAP